MESREFLLGCLQRALEDQDLVSDVLEACELNSITAVTLGKEKLSVEATAEMLFLTEEEAKAVIQACQELMSEEADAEPKLRLEITCNADETVSVSIFEAASRKQQANTSNEDIDVPEEPATVEQFIPATPDNVSENCLATKVDDELAPPPVVVEETIQEPEPSPMEPLIEEEEILLQTEVPSPQAEIPPPQETLAPTNQGKEEGPALSFSEEPTFAPKNKSQTRPHSALAQSTPSPLSRPGSAKSSATNKARPESSRMSVRTSTVQDGSSVPSYLRPTAAHVSRSKKEDVEAQAAAEKSPKKAGLLARMGSTLLAPTRAFVARMNGEGREKREKKDPQEDLRRSMMLENVLSKPQGQRVTDFKPFQLRSDMRPKSVVLSKEELDMIEAKEKAFKRHEVPKHVKEQRPLEFRANSLPKKPDDIFQPFRLASLDRHQKMMEEINKKHEEGKKAEEDARRFKAREFDKNIVSTPSTPRKPDTPPATKAIDFHFASEERVKHYQEVVKPKKDAKEAEQNKAKLEELAKQQELENMSIEEYRKKLEFKAMAMPDFRSVFKPDPTKAKAVTQSQEFKLNTDARLGKPTLVREDKDGPGLGSGRYDGAGYSNAFASTLRSSKISGLPTTPASLRASMVLDRTSSNQSARSVDLRKSMNSPLGLNSLKALPRDAGSIGSCSSNSSRPASALATSRAVAAN